MGGAVSGDKALATVRKELAMRPLRDAVMPVEVIGGVSEAVETLSDRLGVDLSGVVALGVSSSA